MAGMGPMDQTSVTGLGGRFQTTQWSVIRAAQTDDQTRRRMIVGNLMERYWRPVYSYLRHKGCNHDRAKDLTQGFFCEIVWKGELFRRADQSKGRFRTLLLTALERYAISTLRKDSAQKRRPAAGLVELKVQELPALPTTRTGATAEDVFYHTWAADLLENVLSDVREECGQTGMRSHWLAFEARVLAPILHNVEPSSLAEICRKHGIEDETRASNMIITVKRRFQAVLRRRLRDLVVSEEEAQDEFREILNILSRQRAG